MAFVGCREETCLLYVRDWGELEARPLADTEGARCPFFSPDGRFIGFGADNKLKKVSIDGGPVVTIADAPQLRGGSWGEDGTIFFTHGRGGLMRVSTDGGEARRATALGEGDYDHRWPLVLPGGPAALFDALETGTTRHSVHLLDLRTGGSRLLIEDAVYPRLAATGPLLFGRSGSVFGVPFDHARLAVDGPPVPLLQGVVMNSVAGAVNYDVGRDGTLVYSPAPTQLPGRTIVWVDRQGRPTPASSRRGPFQSPRLSPDGRKVGLATSVRYEFGDNLVLDLARDTWTRATEGSGGGIDGWLPDGERLLVTQAAPDSLRLIMVRVDGTGASEVLSQEEAGFHVAVAPDGRSFLVSRQSAPSQWDIWRVPLEGDRTPQPWLVTPNSEMLPSFSPDGRFVVFRSSDSGRAEVYVRPSAGGTRHQVSTRGGTEPRWSRDGRELFYVGQGRLWAARVRTSPTPAFEEPEELFVIPEEILTTTLFFYDVAADGQRFLMVQKDPEELKPLELVVVPNWLDEVRAKMAPAR